MTIEKWIADLIHTANVLIQAMGASVTQADRVSNAREKPGFFIRPERALVREKPGFFITTQPER